MITTETSGSNKSVTLPCGCCVITDETKEALMFYWIRCKEHQEVKK